MDAEESAQRLRLRDEQIVAGQKLDLRSAIQRFPQMRGEDADAGVHDERREDIDAGGLLDAGDQLIRQVLGDELDVRHPEPRSGRCGHGSRRAWRLFLSGFFQDDRE